MRVFLALALSLTACGTPPRAIPFADAKAVQQLDSQETRLWDESDRVIESIETSGQIYDDPELRTYLQSILDRLYPEFEGVLKVEVLKAPVLNAFALPNGSIYVHTGLIARMHSEAQLASVLAHEGAHFTHRHSWSRRTHLKSTGPVTDVECLDDVALVSSVIGVSSICGYTRDLESDADRVGFERLVAAGYDPREAPRAFEHLLAQTVGLDTRQPFFFSTAPRLEARIESFEDLLAGAGRVDPGEPDSDAAYEQRTLGVRLYTLEQDVARRRHASVLTALQSEAGRARIPVHMAEYYTGKALLMRGHPGDEALAIAAFERALGADASFAPTHRELGRVSARAGDSPQARRHLREYLRLDPSASDRAYVQQQLNDLEQAQ